MKAFKKFCLTAVIALFFLLFANGIQKHTTPAKLNQVGSVKRHPGTLGTNKETDIVLYWRIGRFGKTFPLHAFHKSENQRHIYILTM